MPPKKGRGEEVPPEVDQALVHGGSSNDLVPAFFEMRVWLVATPGRDDCFDLRATLRANAAELAQEDRLIEVRALRASLRFDLDGLEEDPREPRFGDLQLEAEHRTKVTRDVVSEGKMSARAGARGTLSPLGLLASASAEGAAQGQKSVKTTRKDKTEEVARRVLARPNHQWDVQEPEGGPLDGSYLVNAKLCVLRRKAGANRIRVTGRLSVRRKDLVFDHEDASWFDRLSQTKRRLLDLFLTRILASDDSRRGPGVLYFSTTELEL